LFVLGFENVVILVIRRAVVIPRHFVMKDLQTMKIAVA
jgi:hypothetical protein